MKRERRSRSLRTKLVVIIALLLASVAIALLAFLPARIESRSRALVEGRAVGIATLLAKATAPALEFDDEASASERLAQLASTPDAIYAEVARADGSALAAWRADNARTVPAPARAPGVVVDDSVLHVVLPISTKGGTQGMLTVGFSLEGLEREKQAAFRLVAVTSAIVLVVGLGVAFLIGTLLIRPIERMTKFALRISEGEHADPKMLDTARSDEVGTMARAFALMLAGIDRHRTFLECQGEASAEGIVIVSNEGDVVSVNRRFREIWTYPDDTRPVDAATWLGLIATQVHEPVEFLDRITYLNANPDEVSTDEVRLLDGRIYDRYSAPIQSADGTRFGRGWYFREITQIRALNADLERRVEERTHALELANQELAERFQQLTETQRQLLDASRSSGMAEVATAVLHNVGNVLNSVNVSANLVLDRHKTARVLGVRKVVDMLAAQPDLGEFFATNPRGKQLPRYLEVLAHAIDEERDVFAQEMTSLQKNVDHIKVIVSSQQANAKQGGVLEQLTIESLIDDALTVSTASQHTRGVTIVRSHAPTKPVTCDRNKAFQIVMNFLANAKYAVQGNAESARQVVVRTRMQGEAAIVVEVEDNGMGIAPENLGKVFNLGFTTKATGHGFGLHSAACCAMEMGGAVAVESAGTGMGACFRLTIPVVPKASGTPPLGNFEMSRG
jgi:signal transduction histidine kinase